MRDFTTGVDPFGALALVIEILSSELNFNQ
jgi:hypothetical protein